LADTRASADNEEARARRFRSAEQVEREGTASIADELIRVLLGTTTLSERPEVVERVRALINSNQPHAVGAAQRAMAGRRDSSEVLSKAPGRVLLVTGAEDSFSSPADNKRLQESIPGSRLAVIDDAGHLSNLESPESFTEALSEFLTSLVSDKR